MDQVSSFFENILTVEGSNENDHDAKRIEETQLYNNGEKRHSNAEKRESSSYDLSSYLWSSSTGQESGNGGNGSTNSGPSRTTGSSKGNTPSSGSSMLMEKMISMMLPMNATTDEGQNILQERIENQKSRPSLSVNVMSKNSILLVSRLSVPFETIDQIIIFFSWGKPSFNLAILLLATHIVLKPILLTALPFIYILVAIMVPHYLNVHPPDKSILNPYWSHNPIPSDEPIRPPEVPKPVPELSREFLLNLTDLQNHMLLYVIAYDFIVWITDGLLYYKDENTSNLVLIICIFAIINNLYFAPRIINFMLPLIPFKFCLLVLIWGGSILMHPFVRNKILEWLYNEDTRLQWVTINNRIDELLQKNFENDEMPSDIANPSQDSYREVEIYELHRLNPKTKIWDLVGFCDDYYTVNNPLRQIGGIIVVDDGNEQEIITENSILEDQQMCESNNKYQASISSRKSSKSSHRSKEDTSSLIEKEESPNTISNFKQIDENNELDGRKSSISTESESDQYQGTFTVPAVMKLKDIKPPVDWEFTEAEWTIDLDTTKWVSSNMIADIVYIDGDEKWVYDVSSEILKEEKTPNESIFRRRRWIRSCRRSRVKENDPSSSNKRESQSFADYFM